MSLLRCLIIDSDGGLPFSRFFSRVHSRLDLPLNSLYLTTVLVIIFGCVFLGSSSAFNAIISASVVALGVSYAIPPAIHCMRGRNKLPDGRIFKLPSVLGWVVNLVRRRPASFPSYLSRMMEFMHVVDQLGLRRLRLGLPTSSSRLYYSSSRLNSR